MFPSPTLLIASKHTLFDITKHICDAAQARAEQDKHYGVILIPEGLIESIPEVYALLQEIHSLLRQGVSAGKISNQLSPWASALFGFLPLFIRKQLLLLPESDDSAQLSQIETEKLLPHLVEIEINKRMKEGTYKLKEKNSMLYATSLDTKHAGRYHRDLIVIMLMFFVTHVITFW